MTLRSTVRRLPGLGQLVTRYRQRQAWLSFPGSAAYWENRYRDGGSSGGGSSGRLADFKAAFLNEFVARHNIMSVIELGSGDGSQAALADYPAYLGLDISPTAVRRCQELFADDATKQFRVHVPGSVPTAQLSLSLDVIYHLVEDPVYDAYMNDLFNASTKWVIVYSSDKNESTTGAYLRHRRFTDWIEKERQDWQLTLHVPNPYPAPAASRYDPSTSFADFFVFRQG